MPGSETVLGELVCPMLCHLLEEVIVAKIAGNVYREGNATQKHLHTWMEILQTMHKSDQPSPHERRVQPTVAQSKRILEWMTNLSHELASSHPSSAMNNEDATVNPLAPIHAAILPQAPPTMPSVISQKFPSTQEVSHCNQIVDVNLTSETKAKLTVGSKMMFTYEVTWKPSTTLFSKRYDKYLDPNFFQHRIHWFSIFNSFMMVIFLVGLVSMILMRTLRKDYARYSKEDDLDDMERDLGDEYGWKQVHGDVFRSASYPLLFSSLVGSGYQLAVVGFLVIIMSIIGDLYTERGSILTTSIFVYAATAPVNGYFGGSLYSRQSGKGWIKQMLFSTALFPSMICGTAFLINFVAIYYRASRAIPFTSMLSVAAICLFVILPLNLVGTVLGRNMAGTPDYPCRINTVPRPIPEKKWFMEPAIIVCLGGILPFGSIFIEMYFIFTSFWAYKIYFVFGFMFLVFFILIIVTMCVTIVCTYFLLNAEDYRWQWTSFLSAASTAVYVYFYSFYYFFFKTKMYGFFQTTFYFGYMALFSMALGILCGTLGYVGASAFVKKIYSTVKID
ncbi:Transmembrane 9 superfamily member 3 [Paramuricea clavata]|uniref:Transmembrane 9 superfamily member n=2 Tax=Paramuricea clavata TaxID=317549 RepID=A0A7D9IIN3_PARCT|nr:Transmembrane 9 superfamily member 3 [Paramuricea clavata]